MGDFDDINIKIAVDAAGAESGLNAFSSAIDKVSENITNLGEGIDFADKISDNAKDSISALDDLQSAIDAALGSASGQAFAIDINISEAEANIEDLGSAIEAAAAAGFNIPIDVDVSQAETAIDELSSMMGNIPAGIDLSGTAESLSGVDTALKETTSNTESLGDALAAPMSAPFIVTAGDITNALDSITAKIQEVESSVAGFNKLSAGIEQISGISADAAKQLAIAISDEDMSIQGALESEKILGKQHVDSITNMESLLGSWKDFANANDEQAASLQEKLIPAWNQFGITADEQPKYMDVLTTLFQETTLSSSDFSGAIVKTGKDLSEMGLSLDQVAKLYLTLEESGYSGRKGAAALSGAITDVNKAAEETGTSVPKGTAAFDAIIKQIGITPDKVTAANEAFDKSAGAVDRWSEAMDKGDTSSEKLGAQIAKTTAGLQDMITPLAPAATGVAELANVGAQLAIFDAFIGGGRLKGGLDTVISKLPLIGAGAAAATPEIEGAAGALALLGGPITIAAIAAAGVAIAAYATNFGGFADNINDSISTAQDAITEFGAGNYEEAGRLIAVSISEGFEALGDLLIDVVKNLPELKADADKLTKGLKEGMKEAAKGVGEGLRSELEKYLNSAKVEVSTFIANINAKFKEGGFKTAGEYVASEIITGINTYVFDLSGLSKNIEEGVNKGNWKPAGEQIGDLLLEGIKFKFGPGVATLISGAEIVGSAIGGFSSPVSTKQKQSFVSSVTKNAPTYTAVPVASTDISQWKYGGPSTGIPTVTVKIDASQVTTAMAKEYAASEHKLTGAAAASMAESGMKSDSYKSAVANWINSKNADTAATTSLTTETKSAASKIKSYSSAADALKDDTLQAGDNFKVGSQEYKKTIDTAAGTAKYAAQEQGAAADLTRAQSKLDADAATQRTKELDAITKEQTAAAKKVTDANKKYADAIDKAAFDYQQAVKYGGTSEQLSGAKTTYQKKLDEITYNASREGVSLEGLNTSMQVGSDTANNLKTTYTNINSDLKKQIGELEAERQKKISTAKAGTTVDTSSIDKKIDDLNKKIRENESAISSSTATVQRNTVAVKSSTGGQTASIDALREAYAKVQPYTDRAIINSMSAADLVRNLADFGVALGGVNEELGTSVSQLDAISQSVQDISSTDAFSRIQNQFADFKAQFDSGAISQEQYLDGLRKASAETDTLSRSTNILKGEQKEAVLQFERELKESLRRISAGTYGEAPISAIGGSLSKLGGVSSGGISQSTIAKMDQLDDAYVKQGISSGKAAALQFTLNDALSDGNVKLSEAYSYLANYNQVVGDNTNITQDSAHKTLDMMNAMQEANKLNQLYSEAMKEGGISTDELAGIQAQQQQVQDALTQATAMATGSTGQLPPALQAVANAVNSVVSQIYAQLQTATSAAQSAVSAQQQIANLAAAAGASYGKATGQTSPSITISNNQFGQTTTASDMIRAGLSRLSL